MTKLEFENLAGYEVSNSDYIDIIEPMYMATNLSKDEFINVIDKKRFALKTKKQYIAEMKKIAKHLKDTCDHYTDYEAINKLNAIAEEYKERLFAQGFLINSKYTMEHLGECRGCSYPASIDFYNFAYSTIDTIDLI
nr:MAG TPA: hypothetical protein [Bacteriophage sp.]